MAQLTVEANIDSFIEGLIGPDLNQGLANACQHHITYLGSAKALWSRAIGNFDVSALAGFPINSAKLVRGIHSLTNGGFSAILSRCERPADWVEDEVTWNEYRNGNAWDNAGGDFDDAGPPAKLTYSEASATGTYEITGLKDFVEDALTNRSGIVSIITRLADENPPVTTGALWRSKEHGSDVWRLVIDYTPTNPGRRGLNTPHERGAPATGPASVTRPARTAGGIAPARPRRPRH